MKILAPKSKKATGKAKPSSRPTFASFALSLLKKTGLILLVVLGALIIIFSIVWIWAGGAKTPKDQMVWGLTYSSLAAQELNLDPHDTYLHILNELKPKRLRLVAYWNQIQPGTGQQNYNDLDFQVAEAEKRGIPYTIAVGRRVPRYPECFAPDWAKRLGKSDEDKALLNFVSTTINRYNQNPHLLTWQVENEPYLSSFGVCPPLDEGFLQQEITLARSLSGKQIWGTDTGELSTWIGSSKFADIFGSTLYRVVINGNTGKVFHHVYFPELYTRRANLIKKLHPNIKKAIIAELQAEPWADAPLLQRDKNYYNLTMDHTQFQKNIKFASDTGLAEIYFWGAEWWYYEKLQGDDFFWNTAAQTFQQSAN